MQARKRSRLSFLKKLVIASAGLVSVSLLLFWLALPRMIQSEAEKFVAEKTGHRLTLAQPEFNLADLSVRLTQLQLHEADGKPLLAFDTLLIDLAAASLTQRAWIFDAIQLNGLAITLVELPDARLNWTPFIDALNRQEDQATASAPATVLPRIDIRHFALADGTLDFADRRTAVGFATRVAPLDLTLNDLSTRPDTRGQFQLTANTSGGARLALQGELTLNPVGIVGRVTLDALDLGQLAPYLKQALPAPPAGMTTLAANYRIGNGGDQLDLVIDGLQAQFSDLRLPLQAGEGAVPRLSSEAIAIKDGHFEWAKQVFSIGTIQIGNSKLELPGIDHPPQFAAVTLDAVRIDLAARSATLAQITLLNGRLQATRNAQGDIDLLRALQRLSPPRDSAAPRVDARVDSVAAVPPAWHYRIDQLAVTDLGVILRDAGIAPSAPAELALEDIDLTISGLSDDLTVALPLQLSFKARDGGRFESSGTLVPVGPAGPAGITGPDVALKLKLVDLALQPAQPYLSDKTTLTLAAGSLSSQGQATYNAQGLGYRGDVALRNLRLNEAGNDKPVLAWKLLASRDLTLTPQQLDLGELRLSELDTRLIINADKTLNFQRLIKPPAAAAEASTAPAAVSALEPTAAAQATPPFAVTVDRLRFYKGQMDFADHSLVMPFGTRIHDLRGSISNLSPRDGTPGQIELDGEVDEYGMARAVGAINLFNPTDFMDLRVIFRNVEMTRLTPYTATFAGRKIDSGKLSLNLQYKIKQRQLQSENQVIMERLTLGERIESPTAQDLPLDLAIAILQDADGRIDLGLPVAGSLDDPEFSYGQIVWKAIRNVLTKIVSAPFRALGALFGDGEKPENIAFEAGATQLTPPEREKLVRLAGALAKRPGLRLTVGTLYTEADRLALQDVQLRRAVLTKIGQHVSEKGDPGPLSTRQPKVQAALESLFAERVGKSDLAVLKDGFRQANPGQLEESTAGKVMSRLSGLLREKQPLSAGEVAQLKGTDFYTTLFEQLRTREAIDDARLQALAQARGNHMIETLQSSGVAVARLQLLPAEKGESTGDEIPIKLTLEAANSDTTNTDATKAGDKNN